MTTTIFKYKELIQNLPVGEQSFNIKSENWEKLLNQSDLEILFTGNTSICLNRQDVHDTNILRLFILKTILWGYPSGMRGNNFSQINSQLEKVVEILNIPERAQLTMESLPRLQTELNQIHGLGLSTYSKLLYFRDFKFDGINALILDERLIRVFNKDLFIEFESLSNISSSTAPKKYKNYIQLMHDLSNTMAVSSANIEQFLFLFGNHLKPIQ